MWYAAWLNAHPFVGGIVALTTGIGTGALLEKAVPPVAPGSVLGKSASSTKSQFSLVSLIEAATAGAATRTLVMTVAKWMGLAKDNATTQAWSAMSRWEPYLLAPVVAAISGDVNSLWIALGTLSGAALLHVLHAVAPNLLFRVDGTPLLRMPAEWELPFAVILYAAMFALKKMLRAPGSVFDLRSVKWTPLFCGLAMGGLHFLSIVTTGHPISIVQPILRLLSPATPTTRAFLWSHPFSSLMLLGIALGSFVSSRLSGTFAIRKSTSKSKLRLEERIVLASIGLAGFILVRYFP